MYLYRSEFLSPQGGRVPDADLLRVEYAQQEAAGLVYGNCLGSTCIGTTSTTVDVICSEVGATQNPKS